MSGALYAESQRLIKAALEGAWPEADRRALADLIVDLGFAKIDFQSREKEVRRALRQLQGES